MKFIKNFFNLTKTITRAFKLCFSFSGSLLITFGALAIVVSLLPLAQNAVLGNIINAISDIAVGKTSNGLNPVYLTNLLVLAYIVAILALRIVNEIKLYIDQKLQLKIEHNVDTIVLRKRAEIDLAHYEDPKFQNLLQKASNRGVWPIYNLVDQQIENIASVITIVVSSIITTGVSVQLYLVAMISAIPLFIVQLKYGQRLWGIWSENSERKRLYYALREHIASRGLIAETKLLQASGKLLGITDGIMAGFAELQTKNNKQRVWYSAIAGIISAAGFGYVFYKIIEEVLAGRIETGTMVFLVAVLAQLISSMSDLLANIAKQFSESLYVKDIFSILDTKPYVVPSSNPKKLNLIAPPLIELQNVGFQYVKDGDWILKNVSFTIEPGQQIALVGQNGAGKSTLVKLIMRIYDPTEGRILINGIDLKEIDLEEWISYVAVLLQKYSMYEFPVSESIAIGRPDEKISQEKVEISAHLSGADEFIKEYEKGYEQQVGKEFDKGIEPSQGQLQKLALARTLYRLDSGFLLILDEPTAAIDPLAEADIFESMEKATKGKNLILITHRFNTVKGVDKTVVLEHGMVVEVGNHSELMAKQGHYAAMFESQAKGFVEGLKIND